FWHFHQPMYSKPDDPTLPLPWVRLHCLKDYLDMLKHVQEFPEVQASFNFTPSLLMQIRDYASGKASDEQFLLFKKKAEELQDDEKIQILRDFFLANWENMIGPYPRYLSLLLKRGKNIVEDELPAIAQMFKPAEWRDLQVWSNIVWIDPIFREDIKDLFEKGKNFKEEDKERVIALEHRIIGSIFDEYKKAADAGQIEITTSPLYHPILPLLINSELAKVSNPNMDIPFQFKHPEDAEQQLAKGIKTFEAIFGRKPQGLWPSEGSVCEELIPMFTKMGIRWIATDEEILARSLRRSLYRHETGVPSSPELLYKPWKYKDISMIFRDHVISDLIGFTYYNWDQGEAANDFVDRIKRISNELPSFDNFIIPIILDGENAWEAYANDGTDFFRSVYGELVKQNIPTTTVSGFLNKHEVKNELPSVFPGSWIGANFDIWIGQPEDHVGWKIVADVRRKLVDKNVTDNEIWNKFYMLEGSDWFWWFGSGHVSATTEVFDELFRLTAIWIYQKIGEEPPAELYSSIQQKAEIFSCQPIDRISPAIDGRVTNYYEWYNAGYCDIRRMGGTMHRFAGLFSRVYCGFDDENLYIRFDIDEEEIAGYEYRIKFFKPSDIEIIIGESKDVNHKIDKIGEIAIPLTMLKVDDESMIEFMIDAKQKGIEVDRTPALQFNVKLRDVRLYNWTV
ncbi:MAG: glycoside hydrolase family 57 protein, partial [candidate division WOR-3 bacterium]